MTVLLPMTEAPKNATSFLAWTKDQYGNHRWLVVHWAQGGGDDQPPFRGWFYWSGGGHSEIQPTNLLGWVAVPEKP